MSRSMRRTRPFEKRLKSYCQSPARVCSMSSSCKECNTDHKKQALERKAMTRR